MASSLHNLVGRFIANSFDDQLPSCWRAVTEFPVGSRLRHDDRPRRERQPDFAVVTHTAALRTKPAMFCEMAIWGEVVSSSNQKKDLEDLPVAFFDSDLDDHCGRISHIDHYWQVHVDAANGVLAAFAHDFRYPFPKCFHYNYATSHDLPGTRVLSVSTPFDLCLDLADLVRKVGLESPAPVKRGGFTIKNLEFKRGTLTLASPFFEF